MTVSLDESQRKAGRVVGFAYLAALVPAAFAEFYVAGQLIVAGSAAETARNVIAHERLFRLGIASNLIVWMMDVVLVTALYVVLERVNRNLALLAAFFRLLETAVLANSTLSDLDVLRVLSGADYLQAFEAERLQALARLSMGAHGAAYGVGLMFFGVGSSVFGYLWFKSRYIPKVLAGWGVFSSSLVGACVFAFVIFPDLSKVLTPAYLVPIFIFELTMGLLLLFKPLPIGHA
jgi:uncharacterized protein DUF4386